MNAIRRLRVSGSRGLGSRADDAESCTLASDSRSPIRGSDSRQSIGRLITRCRGNERGGCLRGRVAARVDLPAPDSPRIATARAPRVRLTIVQHDATKARNRARQHMVEKADARVCRIDHGGRATAPTVRRHGSEIRLLHRAQVKSSSTKPRSATITIGIEPTNRIWIDRVRQLANGDIFGVPVRVPQAGALRTARR